MDGGRQKPEESLDSIKRRFDDAKLRFDFASQYAQEVDNDYRSGLTQLADLEARERAIRAESSAHAEYLRVLEIYKDFVTRWKAVHDGAGPQAESARAQPDPTGDGEEQ